MKRFDSRQKINRPKESDNSRLQSFAQKLLEARNSGVAIDLDQQFCISYADALEVQALVQSNLGPISGFKYAPHKPNRPVVAPISERFTFSSGAAVPIKNRIGVEVEIGFKLKRDIEGFSIENAPDYFTPLVAIELVEYRISHSTTDPNLKIADMQGNHGLVVGSEMPCWDGKEINGSPVEIYNDNLLIDRQTTTQPKASHLAKLNQLIKNGCIHLGGLAPGHILITGSLTGTRFFNTNASISAKISGIGRVSLEILKH
jgi:2-keto-4-pentenoate hydratase